MKKSRHIPLDSLSSTKTQLKFCDRPGCENAGEFRAPKKPLYLREYYLFCMDHVREYNKSWDFYQGMSPEEIENSRNSDMTWNRPSWPIGGWRVLLESAKNFDGLDPFLKMAKQPPALPQPIQKALGTLELNYPLTIEVLKKQYKKLAKKYHPDLNPHDHRAGERLKIINESYQTIKKFLIA